MPFTDTFFDGVYCFGLLHEFVGEIVLVDVRRTMDEIQRVLKPAGFAVVATAAGDPEEGLPHVQNFAEAMFEAATAVLYRIDKKIYEDLGCTGRKVSRFGLAISLSFELMEGDHENKFQTRKRLMGFQIYLCRTGSNR